MGSLKRFSLGQIKDQFDLKIFFETGTGWGHGVEYAQGFNWDKIYSVDIMPEIIERFTPKFAYDKRVELICDSSENALKKYCDEIKENVFFYLDAHFPGADLGLADFDTEQNEVLRLPLFSELAVLKEKRTSRGFKDIIVLDDLMLYDEENHYPGDDVKAKFKIAPKNDKNRWKEIVSYFDDTHKSVTIPEESGFVAFLPK